MKLTGVIITTKSSTSSFFAEISRSIKGKLSLYVYKHPHESTYLTIAYTSLPMDPSGLFKDVNSADKSKIISIEKIFGKKEGIIVALKERCEFYDLIESYNVYLLIPYIIDRGKRTFCVFGDQSDINKYLDNLEAYYGKNNITTRKVTPNECIRLSIGNHISAIALSSLTKREQEILVKAFSLGYISHRRKSTLEEISVEMGLAKPTTSIMVRKAIEKLIKNILENTSLQEDFN